MKETKDTNQHYHGCVRKDSMVRMAGGELCEIRQVRRGQCLRGRKSIQLVREVYAVFADRFVRLTLEDGKTLDLTELHPVLTKEGWKQAKHLVRDDKVMSEQGEYLAIKELCELEEGDEAYTLEMDSGETFCCNGIVVGDFIKMHTIKYTFRKEDR